MQRITKGPAIRWTPYLSYSSAKPTRDGKDVSKIWASFNTPTTGIVCCDGVCYPVDGCELQAAQVVTLKSQNNRLAALAKTKGLEWHKRGDRYCLALWGGLVAADAPWWQGEAPVASDAIRAARQDLLRAWEHNRVSFACDYESNHITLTAQRPCHNRVVQQIKLHERATTIAACKQIELEQAQHRKRIMPRV